MAFYYKLKTAFIPTKRKNFVIDKLLQLKEQIDQQIPDKNLEKNLLLATWNIRDFGKAGGYGHGNRLPESLFYIAEILSAFDLIAVQEVNDLEPLETVMSILGRDYDYIATDVADRNAGGNGERMTFIFDKRKIDFKNIAGEIVLPPNLLISKTTLETENGKIVSGKQFRRTPYIVSFQCGWFKFDICTVHIFYGAESGAKLNERIDEIQGIAHYLSRRADEALQEEKSLILLGDFNIVHPEHQTMKALTEAGFVIPKNLQLSTNIDRSKFYDQIAFKTTPQQIEYIERIANDPKQQNSGVFSIFENCYNHHDLNFYKEEMAKQAKGKEAMEGSATALKDYYEEWRTWQLSDHNVLWTRLNINNSISYLNNCRVNP